MGKLDGKVAFITGASSGIGRAAALKLGSSGAKVALIDIKEENARNVKDLIEDAEGTAMILECNISKPAEVENSFHKVAEAWGKVDIVFANAGINGVIAPIEDLAPEDWDETINTNLKGTFLTVKYAIPHMKKMAAASSLQAPLTGTGFTKISGCPPTAPQKSARPALAKWQHWSWLSIKSESTSSARELSKPTSAKIHSRSKMISRKSRFRSNIPKATSHWKNMPENLNK